MLAFQKEDERLLILRKESSMKNISGRVINGGVIVEERKFPILFYKEVHAEKDLKFTIKNLVEAIILQAIDDLWDPAYKVESLEFFSEEGFNICSEIANISHLKKFKLLRMIAKAGSKTH